MISSPPGKATGPRPVIAIPVSSSLSQKPASPSPNGPPMFSAPSPVTIGNSSNPAPASHPASPSTAAPSLPVPVVALPAVARSPSASADLSVNLSVLGDSCSSAPEAFQPADPLAQQGKASPLSASLSTSTHPLMVGPGSSGPALTNLAQLWVPMLAAAVASVAVALGLFSPSEDRPLSGLAAALAGAKLRKVPRSDSGGDAAAALAAAMAGSLAGAAGAKPGGNGPLGGAPGGGGLMEEMSALLARRRRIAEKGSSPEPEQRADEVGEGTTTPKVSACSTPDMPRKPWERTNTMNGSKSPVIGRPKSTATGSLSANGVPTEGLDYDRLKQDILDEMRKELSKLKEELIDAIREELGKSNTV
ncbi:hypothetical protein J4Q44_G00344980 [Coregonus suidteri]|uniref:VASP tetramerisation domain-containing protein n=1 Tax=Coregonus suidteri TaxID=861788 RepID=A0AAN8KPX1_9TELE